MKKLILCRGLPGSGKSTWAKEFISAHRKFVRVNRDDLRAMLHNGRFSNVNEEMVTSVRDYLIKYSLDSDKSVIVDETSLNPAVARQMKVFAQAHNADFEIKEFDKSVSQCIKDDATRGVNSVGSKVILRMYHQWIKPNEKKLEIDSSKPSAVVVDLDGTATIVGSRNIYNQAACDKDEPNRAVIATISALQLSGQQIIFLTGRDDKFEPQTRSWLKEHFNENYELFMRPAGDERSDYIYKEDVVINQIMNRYNVLACFEDRPRNMEMFRRIGLEVFGVGLLVEF